MRTLTTFHKHVLFLGVFAKLQKVTISSVMSVLLSIRMKQLISHCRNFHEILNMGIFRKSVEKTEVS